MVPAVVVPLVVFLALAAAGAWLLVLYKYLRARRRPPGRRPRPVRAVHAQLPRWRHPGVRWQIFERDAWRCHLCGGEVTQGVTHPERQAQVDHLKPQSTGGGDHDDNLATACKRCNLLKGNSEDNDAVRRAVAAWRAWTDPAIPWSSTMQAGSRSLPASRKAPGLRRSDEEGWMV